MANPLPDLLIERVKDGAWWVFGDSKLDVEQFVNHVESKYGGIGVTKLVLKEQEDGRIMLVDLDLAYEKQFEHSPENIALVERLVAEVCEIVVSCFPEKANTPKTSRVYVKDLHTALSARWPDMSEWPHDQPGSQGPSRATSPTPSVRGEASAGLSVEPVASEGVSEEQANPVEPVASEGAVDEWGNPIKPPKVAKAAVIFDMSMFANMLPKVTAAPPRFDPQPTFKPGKSSRAPAVDSSWNASAPTNSDTEPWKPAPTSPKRKAEEPMKTISPEQLGSLPVNTVLTQVVLDKLKLYLAPKDMETIMQSCKPLDIEFGDRQAYYCVNGQRAGTFFTRDHQVISSPAQLNLIEHLVVDCSATYDDNPDNDRIAATAKQVVEAAVNLVRCPAVRVLVFRQCDEFDVDIIDRVCKQMRALRKVWIGPSLMIGLHHIVDAHFRHSQFHAVDGALRDRSESECVDFEFDIGLHKFMGNYTRSNLRSGSYFVIDKVSIIEVLKAFMKLKSRGADGRAMTLFNELSDLDGTLLKGLQQFLSAMGYSGNLAQEMVKFANDMPVKCSEPVQSQEYIDHDESQDLHWTYYQDGDHAEADKCSARFVDATTIPGVKKSGDGSEIRRRVYKCKYCSAVLPGALFQNLQLQKNGKDVADPHCQLCRCEEEAEQVHRSVGDGITAILNGMDTFAHKDGEFTTNLRDPAGKIVAVRGPVPAVAPAVSSAGPAPTPAVSSAGPAPASDISSAGSATASAASGSTIFNMRRDPSKVVTLPKAN